MIENSPQTSNIINKLRGGVSRIRDKAVTAWEGMNAEDAFKLIYLGEALMMIGVLLAVNPESSHFTSPTTGKITAALGTVSIGIGLGKLGELVSREFASNENNT